MKAHILDEPELQFAEGQHVDVRAGITADGPLDKNAQNVSVPIRVGIVGTSDTVRGVKNWIERCRGGVLSQEKKLKELRPHFPGMSDQVFGTHLEVRDHWTAILSRQEIAAANSEMSPAEAVAVSVNPFFEYAKDLADRGTVNVLVVAPPPETFALSDLPAQKPIAQDEGLDDASDDRPKQYVPSFHDLFKARALEFRVPCQVVRPDTYGGGTTRRPSQKGRQLQDEATRAWNFHTALYYKAGGVPWRLVRDPSAFSVCYVGVSFYKNLAGDRLLTSVAQVFNERGEGVIVQGGNARLEKDDPIPHLRIPTRSGHPFRRDSASRSGVTWTVIPDTWTVIADTRPAVPA